jgi:hypothetical protein
MNTVADADGVVCLRCAAADCESAICPNCGRRRTNP